MECLLELNPGCLRPLNNLFISQMKTARHSKSANFPELSQDSNHLLCPQIQCHFHCTLVVLIIDIYQPNTAEIVQKCKNRGRQEDKDWYKVSRIWLRIGSEVKSLFSVEVSDLSLVPSAYLHSPSPMSCKSWGGTHIKKHCVKGSL